MVEPIYYAPIIPMILVNGSKGIGTGFSTEIPCYNPTDIIDYISGILLGKDKSLLESFVFVPYYKGFKGKVINIAPNRYLVTGKYTIIASDTLQIVELPIGTWTDDYKKFLETLIDQPNSHLKDFVDMSTDTTVDFRVKMKPGYIQKLEQNTVDSGANGLEKYFKLITTISTTNMHAFDPEEHLQLYTSPKHIIHDFIATRIKLYSKRKEYIIHKLQKDVTLLQNRSRYISSLLDNSIDLRNKNKAIVIKILTDKKFDVIDDDPEYKYLTKMPMDSVCKENVEELKEKAKVKLDELTQVKNTTIEKMWLQDLQTLKSKL